MIETATKYVKEKHVYYKNCSAIQFITASIAALPRCLNKLFIVIAKIHHNYTTRWTIKEKSSSLMFHKQLQ